MPISKESLNRKLFRVLSKYKPKPLDTSGEVTPVEDEAAVFKFTFTKDGKAYGDVFITIDDEHKLSLYYGDDVADSPSAPTQGLDYNDTWEGLLEFLSRWAHDNRLKWEPDDNKDHLVQDMARRKHMSKKEQIGEGYYPMGKKASYSDNVPNVKIVIEHTRQIEEGEQRYRNVNRIFLENQLGERFLLDTKKPGIARVYARHIAEGGKVNDERWGHINSLCEEYNKMAGFVRATRNGQFNESAQQLVQEGVNHYQSLRETLSKMTGKRGYNMYFESWTPALMEDEVEEANLNELFVQETLDPRIESVMPILSKLHKKVAEMKEVVDLAEWADSLLEGGDGGEASEEPTFTEPVDELPADGADAPLDELDESGLQAYLGNKKYGKEGMDALRKAGRDHASKEKMAKIRAKYDKLDEEDVEEDFGTAAAVLGGAALGAKLGKTVGIYRSAKGDEEAGTAKPRGRMERLKGSWKGLAHPQYDDDGEVHKINPKYRYEEGLGDVAKKVGSALKTAGKKALDVVAPDDEELLRRLQKDMGAPASSQHGKPSMAKTNEEESIKSNNPVGIPEEELDEVDMGQYDAVKSTPKGKEDDDVFKKFREKIRQYGDELEQRQKEKDVDEGLDANQKAAGQLGPTEPVGKNEKNLRGKLVGANENFIGMAPQAVAEGQEDLDAILRIVRK
jgi:hypothetical protein